MRTLVRTSPPSFWIILTLGPKGLIDDGELWCDWDEDCHGRREDLKDDPKYSSGFLGLAAVNLRTFESALLQSKKPKICIREQDTDTYKDSKGIVTWYVIWDKTRVEATSSVYSFQAIPNVNFKKKLQFKAREGQTLVVSQIMRQWFVIAQVLQSGPFPRYKDTANRTSSILDLYKPFLLPYSYHSHKFPVTPQTSWRLIMWLSMAGFSTLRNALSLRRVLPSTFHIQN